MSEKFAKEAMAHQKLDHDEVLNVRWATMDPNPGAQKREMRKIEEQAAEAIRRALPPSFVAELEGRGGDGEDAKKRRKIEGSFGLEGYDAPDNVWYEREKAEWIADQRGLTGGDEMDAIEGSEKLLIEHGAAAAEAEEEDAEESGGILAGSTLAALKSRQKIAPLVAAKKTSDAGPLVGYGSESEEED
jgi:hypothetical protein